MLEKGSGLSYLVYGGTSGVGMASLEVAQKEKGEAQNSLVAKAAEEAPWLIEVAPDLVANGSIAVKDGSILLFGLSALECLSFFAIVLTLALTFLKFRMDFLSFKLNRKRSIQTSVTTKCPECGTKIE